VFAHSARTPADIIYRAELDYMSTRIDNFKLHLICERSKTGQIWGGYRGFLSREMLQLIAPDFLEREVFCCGPMPYMRAVRRLLGEAGYDMARYHEESFGETPAEDIASAEVQAAVALAQADEPQVSHWVTFSESGKSVQAELGATLHEAAASAGLTIPKACGMGICGTCKVRVVAGETAMEHNGGISEEEIADGYVLSCCTRVKGNVEVAY
jgi:ferredoxin-NADP reductase